MVLPSHNTQKRRPVGLLGFEFRAEKTVYTYDYSNTNKVKVAVGLSCLTLTTW